MYSGFSTSVTGASHIAQNLICQDFSAYFINDEYAVAVVADGHGSKKHFRSDIGSKLAVESTVRVISRFYSNPAEFNRYFPDNHKMVLRNIEKQIIAEWNTKIAEHYHNNSVTIQEKQNFNNAEFESIPVVSYYGTTLVTAVAGKNFSFGFQIGDGSLVGVFEDGETSLLIGYDESNPANITSSMCNSNALTMFSDFYTEEKRPLALFASTDGLYTSFGSDSDFLDYHAIITSRLSESGTFEKFVVRNLKKRSNYGTQDDISLSCVYNSELIKSNPDSVRKIVEEYKKRQMSASHNSTAKNGR
ncbi:MAG: protein phosphatase 2C domain-containing protein [Ruminococcus sp.]|nr:protein phosphatase 2C domain-containing protein [Ruminococcus sp.]MDE7226116.1 protein phosphatase 2C domain-containing protein [Ruminococcus sp.]